MEQPIAICFDLGGVLLQIRHTWDEICEHLGFSPPPNGPHPLTSFAPFQEYQAGSIDETSYLCSLSSWLKVPLASARDAHLAILVADYPGALQLVERLEHADLPTCCFSNTNGLHWPVLCDRVRHPAIAALRMRFASHELGLAKPDAAAYQAVEQRLPLGSRYVFFDDSVENVAAAAREGWEAFVVNPSADPVRQVDELLDSLNVWTGRAA